MRGAGSAWKHGEVWACGLCETARGAWELQVVFWEWLAPGLAGGWAHVRAVDVETGGLRQRSPSWPQSWEGLCWAHVCVILDRALRWPPQGNFLLYKVDVVERTEGTELVIFPRGHMPAHRWCRQQAGLRVCCTEQGKRRGLRGAELGLCSWEDSLRVAPSSLWSVVCTEMLSCINSPGMSCSGP